MKRVWIAFVLLVAFGVRADDWPQWRGTNRDGISRETKLLASWPAEGPRVLWRITGLGQGYASMAISKGRLYTQGQRSDGQFVLAFDAATGKKLWETRTAAKYTTDAADDGPHGTPTVDGDRVFALALDGTLVSLDAATG